MSEHNDSMKNQRLAEYFILSMIIAIGTPVCLLWGFQNGERMGAKAFLSNGQNSSVISSKTSMEMFLSSTHNIEEGKELFQKNCTACHGEQADGKGPAATALTPPPRDFMNPDAKWTRSREPQDVFKTISEGSPGTAMPSFSASLAVKERWALTHYLGTLPGMKGQFKPVDEATARNLAGETP